MSCKYRGCMNIAIFRAELKLLNFTGRQKDTRSLGWCLDTQLLEGIKLGIC